MAIEAHDPSGPVARRAFLAAAVGLTAVAGSAEGQAARAARVGVLRPAPDGPIFQEMFGAFQRALSVGGFVEGRNLAIELRVRAANAEDTLALARELVSLNLDAILAVSPVAVSAAARSTRSIPIVAIDLESDPLGTGMVASWPRPGGNVTGIFLDVPELCGKWIEVLKDVVPNLSRIAVLADRGRGQNFRRELEAAARILKVQLVVVEVGVSAELAAAVRSGAEGRAAALVVLPSPMVNSARKNIAELAVRHRMPAIMPFAGFADDGGLLAYGPDTVAIYGQAGGIVVKVLRGAPVGNIPIERPARLEFVLNLKTAKALGLTISRPILLRADRVIQ